MQKQQVLLRTEFVWYIPWLYSFWMYISNQSYSEFFLMGLIFKCKKSIIIKDSMYISFSFSNRNSILIKIYHAILKSKLLLSNDEVYFVWKHHIGTKNRLKCLQNFILLRLNTLPGHAIWAIKVTQQLQ